MTVLASVAPLTGLHHVKRIRKPQGPGVAAAKLQILLCPVHSTRIPAVPSARPIPGGVSALPTQHSAGPSFDISAVEGTSEGLQSSVHEAPLPAAVQQVVAKYGLKAVCVQVCTLL